MPSIPRPQIVAIGLIIATGIAFFALSFGESLTLAGHTISMPYKLLRHMPGLAGIRVTARFFVITQLALAVLVAIGISWATRRLSIRWRTGVMLALVRDPRSRDGDHDHDGAGAERGSLRRSQPCPVAPT